MGAGLIQELTKKINALNTTKKIVRVTELSTLSKLGGYRQRAESAVAYYTTILKSLQQLSNTISFGAGEAKEENIAILVVTSNRGLCGAYNLEVFKQIDKLLTKLPAEANKEFIVIGNQGHRYLEKKSQTIIQTINEPLESINLEQATILTTELIRNIRSGRFDSIYVVFTQYLNAVQSQAQFTKIYPDLPEAEPTMDNDELSGVLDFEEQDDELEFQLLENYLCGLIYSMLLYSVASEYCARRIAMKAANENTSERLDESIALRKKNRLQQATSELIDIITGAQIIKEESE